MGGLFSRKAQKSSKDVLEELDKQIHSKTKSRRKNQQYERSFISYLLLLSFALYLSGLAALYWYLTPSTWGEWLVYLVQLLLFPLVVYLIKKLLNCYFHHRKAQFDQELATLHEDKRKVLNEVMEKETYKVAVELLQKYEPTHPSLHSSTTPKQDTEHALTSSQKRIRHRVSTHPTPTHPSLIHQHTPSQHHQSHIPTPLVSPTSITSSSMVGGHRPTPLPLSSTPINAGNGMTAVHTGDYKQQPFIPPGMCLGAPPGPPTPCPILPRSRTNVDKMVEYLVGDGPNNRYALICCKCHSHNGMCLRDEFEYMTFRCAYCYHMNPAHKSKPNLRNTTNKQCDTATTKMESTQGLNKNNQKTSMKRKSSNPSLMGTTPSEQSQD